MTELSTRPSSLLRPMVALPVDRLQLGTGPGNMSPRVRAACSLPALAAAPCEEQTKQVMADIRDGIRYVFQTATPYALCVSGSANAGMEASCCNLLEPGEVFLIVIAGHFGTRMKAIASRYGLDIRCISKPIDQIFTLAELEQAIVEHKPKVMFITHGESSGGALQEIEHLGRVCHKYDCLLIVDAVTTLGVTPVFMDEWELDVVFTGGQKVLGALTGLTPLALSEAAWQKVKNRRTPIPSMFLDFTVLAIQCGCFGSQINIHSPYHHHLYSLREALAELVDEGLVNSWAKHKLCAERLYRGLAGMGLKPVVDDPVARLPTITTVRLPSDIDGPDFRKCLNDRFNILISPGVFPYEEAQQLLRIGIFGYNARPEVVDKLLTSMAATLEMFRKESKTIDTSVAARL